jgi:serine/threonine protein kinase
MEEDSLEPAALDHPGQLNLLVHLVQRMEALADQTAVHRKKFEYALSQIRRFLQDYPEGQHSAELTPSQASAFSELTAQFRLLRALIMQNLLQTWTYPTLENPSNYVVDQLREIFTRVREAASVLDPDGASLLDAKGPDWRQFNIVDLRAIQASFIQYLHSKTADAQLSRAIENRLISLNRYLAAEPSNSEYFATRVFSPIPVNYQEWRVDLADFEEVRQVASGVSATVHYGRHRRTGAEVAIKKFRFAKLNGPRLQSFQREVACLATATHPTLLKLIGATDIPPFCIITEWMPNGSLFQDLHRFHRLDATGRSIAAYDIARGMQFLHSVHIVHRDMKSLNCLLDAHNRIRICDFGFSRQTSEDSQMTYNLGTPHWMAPEVLSGTTNYTSKVDVYGYGIVLWELATGQTPYSGIDATTIVQEVQVHDIRPNLPPDCNPAMRDLMTQCWDRNPDHRPTFDEIVRRFESGSIVFNGTNKEYFMRYIHQSATRGDLLNRHIEQLVKKVVSHEMSLDEATKKIAQTGIPLDIIDQCWNAVAGVLGEFPSADVANYLLLYIKTSKKREAIQILRAMPKGEVPGDVVNSFVAELPTGSEDLDTAIIVVACRNGCADLCVVCATSPIHIELALEVVSHDGIDVHMRPAVIDKCVQLLGGSDMELAGSALKCLLSLRELTRVPKLERLLGCENTAVSSGAFLALATLAEDRSFPAGDGLDRIVAALADDARAGYALVMACRDPGLAERFVEKLEAGVPDGWVNESVLQAVCSAARHKKLRARIAEVVVAEDFARKTPALEPVVRALLDKLQPSQCG